MEDDDKLVGVAAEPEPKELTPYEITEDFFTELTSEDHLQQAINRVLRGNLDEIIKQALQQALQKALEPIVTQAIEKALAPVVAQAIEPAPYSMPHSTIPSFVAPDSAMPSILSVCPEPAHGPCNKKKKNHNI
jgi:hypothetical protein